MPQTPPNITPQPIRLFTPGSFDTPLDADRMNELVRALNALLTMQGTRGVRVIHSQGRVVIEGPESIAAATGETGQPESGTGGGGSADPIWLP